MPLVSIYLSVTFGFWALAKSKFNDACRLNQRLILLLLLSFLFVRRNNNNYPRRIRTPLGDGARIFEPFECDKILALAQTCQITSESSSKRYTRKVSSTFWRKFTTHTKFHSNYCFCSFLHSRKLPWRIKKWNPRWVHNACLLSWHYAPKWEILFWWLLWILFLFIWEKSVWLSATQ